MMAEANPPMQLNELLDFDPVPDLVGKPMDFADFLNLDGFDESVSAAESSPQTMSPNHTPSPGCSLAPSPPHYDEDQFTFVFPDEKKLPLGGPATMGEIHVKEEPMERQSVPAPIISVTPAAPAPVAPPVSNSGVTLPAAQQEALQQLLANFMTYQQQFGYVGMAQNEPSTAANGGASINPSLVFSTASSPSSSVTPALTSSAMTNSTPSTSATPSVQAASAPAVVALEMFDEPLVPINPGETPELRSITQMSRTTSTFSNDTIDDKIDKLVPLSSIFSTGRGKGGKKGGGMSSVVRGEDEEVDEDESWRPSPEEYKKLSSKEKRQLRNKLSARAFRTRRKDYIGTLEAHIKDRDSVIDAIRAELQTSRAENLDLRRELEALKSSTMSVLHPESAEKLGQSPAMLKALAQADLPAPVQPSAAAAPGSSPRRSFPVNPVVNTRKDVSSYDARGFWGGSNDILGGGNTICHTVFSPELTLPPQPNLNPLLNNLSSPVEKPVSLQSDGNHDIDSSTFADWAADTPYSMRSMDSYRMQLWSRLAREAAADKAGVPADMRPKFLANPESSTSPTSAAAVATSAVEHITSRLYSSFWSAFSGSSSKVDTEKLAAVVTGRARLAVVPDKAAPTKRSASTQTSSSTNTTPDDLAHAMAGLKVATGTSSPLESLRVRENPLGAMAGFFKQSSPLPTRA